MSTQHPDNVNVPFFSKSTKLGGEDEVKEAFYAYSHLGMDEQMWDCEGKEVDNYVVKKLLTHYDTFFHEKVLGKDLFLTLRVPNPLEEKAEAKILLETLESIPRSFDASSLFYQKEIAPIFEVILPMTGSAADIDHIYRYYKDFIVARQNIAFKPGDITVGEWIGQFKPAEIHVIPLVEDMKRQIEVDQIVRQYLSDKTPAYQRVFLARSDPAMNYGVLGAMVSNKIALMRLDALSKELDIPMYPIIGAGSAPFRGNLSPVNIPRFLREYPSVQTFTVQSAFKYDYHLEEVRKGIEMLMAHKVGPADKVDVDEALSLVTNYVPAFSRQVTDLAPMINQVAKFIPKRRDRKLHNGLFGYARAVDGVTLPRAISFTASLYSIGVPPELFGLTALSPAEFQRAKSVYFAFEEDLQDALKFMNPNSPYLPKGMLAKLDELGIVYETNAEHKDKTDQIIKSMKDGKTDRVQDLILMAGHARKFLG